MVVRISSIFSTTLVISSDSSLILVVLAVQKVVHQLHGAELLGLQVSLELLEQTHVHLDLLLRRLERRLDVLLHVLAVDPVAHFDPE